MYAKSVVYTSVERHKAAGVGQRCRRHSLKLEENGWSETLRASKILDGEFKACVLSHFIVKVIPSFNNV